MAETPAHPPLDGSEVILYIMAGGQSTRFGSDKARAMVLGEPLLHHAAAPLKGITEATLVVAQKEDQYEDLGFTTIADVEPQKGPIGGVYTALSHMQWYQEEGWCAVVSCDVIGHKATWLQQLMAHATPDVQAVAFRGERWDPLFALYHTRLLPLIHKQMESEELALWQLLEAAETYALPHPPDWHEATPINTQEALAGFIRSQAEG